MTLSDIISRAVSGIVAALLIGWFLALIPALFAMIFVAPFGVDIHTAEAMNIFVVIGLVGGFAIGAVTNVTDMR